MELLHTADTFGELLEADLPSWAEAMVDSRVWDYEYENGEVEDDTPWEPSDGLGDEIFRLAHPPHSAETVQQWLDPEVLREHAEIGGASPGGSIDVYWVDDKDALFDELRSRGYTMERREGLLQEFWDAMRRDD